MGAARVAFVGVGDAVPGAQARHELRQPLAERGRQKGSLRVTLAVARDQVRELFFEEGKEDGSGARLEKERIGEEILCSGVGGGLDQRFEVSGIIGDAGKDGSADDSGGDAREIQLTNGFEPQIGPRGPRFKNACQFGVDGGDCDVDEDAVMAPDLAEKLGVAHDQIRFGDNADLEAAVTSELLQDGARDFVAALGRLVGIGGGADGDLFVRLNLF